jgi:hypothetical protein
MVGNKLHNNNKERSEIQIFNRKRKKKRECRASRYRAIEFNIKVPEFNIRGPKESLFEWSSGTLDFFLSGMV